MTPESIYRVSSIVTHIVSKQEPKVEEDAATTDERDDAHLQDVEDGCGCVEVWEHMSDEREA